jgi:hypothetical protein
MLQTLERTMTVPADRHVHLDFDFDIPESWDTDEVEIICLPQAKSAPTSHKGNWRNLRGCLTGTGISVDRFLAEKRAEAAQEELEFLDRQCAVQRPHLRPRPRI